MSKVPNYKREWLRNEQRLVQIMGTKGAPYVSDAPEMIKIYKYVPAYRLSDFPDKTVPPLDLNYKTGLTTRLYPAHTFTMGEVQNVKYYSDQAHTDLVLEVAISYNRDSMGFALDRTTVRKWYRNDGTAHEITKVTHKEYNTNPVLKIHEGIKRRQNIIDDLIIKFSSIVGGSVGNPDIPAFENETVDSALDIARDFFQENDDAVNAFVKTSSKQVYYSVVNSPHAWLDDITVVGSVTLRQYTMSLVNIWGL